MKTSMILGTALALFISCPSFAFDKGDGGGENFGKHHPCAKILDACKSAGFTKNSQTAGKGLWLDCFNPVVAGTPVAGVTVDPATIKSCQKRRAEKTQK